MIARKAEILIVEDDPALLKGLLDVLVFNGFAARGVENGVTGLETALENRFDLVVLDVMLPGMDGFSICREIRKKKPEQAIMMLTAKGSEDDIVNGLQAGADDYMKKPFSLRELMARVEALLRRTGLSLPEDNLQLGTLLFDPVRLVAQVDGREVELTRREMDIIYYLNTHKNRIVSKMELLEKVWNYTVTNLETRTVDIHIQKLRKKITEMQGDGQLIVTVRGEGYRLRI